MWFASYPLQCFSGISPILSLQTYSAQTEFVRRSSSSHPTFAALAFDLCRYGSLYPFGYRHLHRYWYALLSVCAPKVTLPLQSIAPKLLCKRYVHRLCLCNTFAIFCGSLPVGSAFGYVSPIRSPFVASGGDIQPPRA